MRETVYPLGVTSKAQRQGRLLYRIRASNGTTYATYNSLMASLCERAAKTGRAVDVWSAPGWYYRELIDVALVETQEIQA